MPRMPRSSILGMPQICSMMPDAGASWICLAEGSSQPYSSIARFPMLKTRLTRQSALRIFVKELDDVDEATGLNVELGSGLQFADIFFDGVLADWIAQNKIDRAKQQVADAMRQVYAVRSQLERMH